MTRPRDNILRLDAYAPGEQPAAGTRVVKLNTNESPYPPSPKAMDAIASVGTEALRIYPSPTAQPFREAAARVHGLSADQLIATNGGDELLRLILTCYCKPAGHAGQGGIGVTDPTYSLYPVLASIHDTAVTAVERGDGFSLPGGTAKRWNEAGCAVGFIVNPHAPTGRIETPDTLRQLADEFRGLLVIDEAYVDFAEGDAAELIREGRDNVLLLRSLSKGYGLAGLRFGYGLSHADNIAALDKARDSYNTDAVSQAAAVAALDDRAYAEGCWAKVIAERGRMTSELRQRSFEVPDSHTNFVLATAPGTGAPDNTAAKHAHAIYHGLKERGILVRYFNAPRLDDKLRITIGTPEQNTALLDALDELL